MPDMQLETFQKVEHSGAVSIPSGLVDIEAQIDLPPMCRGLVIFANGSSHSRFSARNRYIAAALRHGRLGTLVADLLTSGEDKLFQSRLNIDLLTERLLGAVRWAEMISELKDLPFGIFGTSTGAASALEAAAELGGRISAVATRAGRPDLADVSISRVFCPCLFIVGGRDQAILPANERALFVIPSETKGLAVVTQATHLFKEPGALEEVAQLASQWFQAYLVNRGLQLQ